MAGPTQPGADAFLPKHLTLTAARKAASTCHGCALWQSATQTVFGEGPAQARLMLVGEQPGNDEDLQGRPFVGPAGRLLNEALQDAGIEREQTYLTNAVKHFKWEPRGKRRIHKRPTTTEIVACRPWLDAEIALVKPAALVCLGATAAQALFGRTFRVTEQRGQLLASRLARFVLATVHPSALLRAPTPEDRKREYARFVADLRIIAQALTTAAHDRAGNEQS
jgi:uracil-DNA glycosylase